MKKTTLIVAALAAAVLATARRPAPAGRLDKPVEITFWHAQTDWRRRPSTRSSGSSTRRIRASSVHDQLGSNGDGMVQKLQAVIGSDAYPDIAYVYGSDVPNVSQSNKVVDITKDIKATGFDWNSLYQAGRETATVDAKFVGFPAVIDNLAVVYNTKLLKAAGVARRRPDWTWTDYRAHGQEAHECEQGHLRHRLPDLGQRGHGLAALADDLAAGREVLDKDSKKALFAGPQGVKAVQLLATWRSRTSRCTPTRRRTR